MDVKWELEVKITQDGNSQEGKAGTLKQIQTPNLNEKVS